MGNCLKGFETDDVSLIPNEGSNNNNSSTNNDGRRSSAVSAVGAAGINNDASHVNAGGGGHHNPAHDSTENERTRSNRTSHPRSSASVSSSTPTGSASRSSRTHHHRPHHRSSNQGSSTPGTQSLRFFESTQQQSNMSAHAAMVGATSLTEDEQVKLAKRLTIIQHLPLGRWDSTRSINNNDNEECVICMCDFADGDELRYLPCMHAYHRHCIDDWLLRYLTCPSCMEPVDSALFSSFDVMPPISSSLGATASTVKAAAVRKLHITAVSPAADNNDVKLQFSSPSHAVDSEGPSSKTQFHSDHSVTTRTPGGVDHLNDSSSVSTNDAVAAVTTTN